MKIKIKNRFTDSLIFETDAESLVSAILAALKVKANLRGADLCDADLRDADLRDADLCGADLCGADLYDADLRCADLRCADLRDADLRDADLRGANLRDADLRGANLRDADLRGADLRDANLRGADLRGANLRDAKNFNLAKWLSLRTILPEGDIVGYKKLQDGIICKLRIPATAKRIGGLTGRKCRAEFAIVLEGEGRSQHDSDFLYKVGETIMPDSFDNNPLVECSNGIHFFITRAEAEAY